MAHRVTMFQAQGVQRSALRVLWAFILIEAEMLARHAAAMLMRVTGLRGSQTPKFSTKETD